MTPGHQPSAFARSRHCAEARRWRISDTRSSVKAQADTLLERSTLFEETCAEREEILRHKWLESEKKGRDIGFDSALVSWLRHHQSGWRAMRRRMA